MQRFLPTAGFFSSGNEPLTSQSALAPPRKSNNFGTLPVIGYAFKLSLVESHKVMSKKALIFAVVVAGLLAGTAFSQSSSESERRVVAQVAPAYPELAKKMHIRGTVKVEAVVRPNGTVKSTRILGGNPVLIVAAQDAVSKWKFEAGQNETTQVVQLAFDGQ